MKALWHIFAAAMMVSVACAAPKKTEKVAKRDPDAINAEEQTKPRWVVILAVQKDFAAAKAEAQKVAKASKVPFSMNGNIFDKKGLRLPDDADDPTWAGEYLARRGNHGWIGKKEMEEHISVERSDGYEGFAKGFYIVVATIAETKDEGLKQEARFKAFAPATYVKRTSIYLGCIH